MGRRRDAVRGSGRGRQGPGPPHHHRAPAPARGAGGARADGSGILRVVRTPGVRDAVASVAPDLDVEEVDVASPTTSCSLRAAGWAEASVLLAGARGRVPVTVRSPSGSVATAHVD